MAINISVVQLSVHLDKIGESPVFSLATRNIIKAMNAQGIRLFYLLYRMFHVVRPYFEGGQRKTDSADYEFYTQPKSHN